MTPRAPYRIPFTVDIASDCVELTNASDEWLPWVNIDVVSHDLMAPVAPGEMPPRHCVRFAAGTLLRSPAAALQVTWLRESGDGPYVWRAVL